MNRTEYLEARAYERRLIANRIMLTIIWGLVGLVLVTAVASKTARICLDDVAACEKMAK